MSVTLFLPPLFRNELSYISRILFGDFLGLSFQIIVRDNDCNESIVRVDGAEAELRLPLQLFKIDPEEWLTYGTLPALRRAHWDSRELTSDLSLSEPIIPVIFGDTKPNLTIKGNSLRLPLDILGSAFFMLSRYEEVILSERDAHDRFPAWASLAYKAGFLNRPIIDEYVEILWVAMQRLWPQLQRKPRSRMLRVTCDVDSPYQGVFSGYAMVRGMAADMLKRRNPRLALGNIHRRWRARRGDFSGDPYLDNIDWMMDVNEQAGNRVAFYFITGGNHALDARYGIDEPVIRRLLCRIHERGHEIGLHPSYMTYQCPEQTQREADMLRRTLRDEGIPCAELGGRQHYLRWETPQTARHWEAAGMDYDSTLSYADRPGFRCGTSREFTMYDVEQRRPLKLRQRPLVLMDCSVVAERYMGMGYTDEALAYMRALKDRAMSVGGEFTLLWHNSYFQEPQAYRLYHDLIQG